MTDQDYINVALIKLELAWKLVFQQPECDCTFGFRCKRCMVLTYINNVGMFIEHYKKQIGIKFDRKWPKYICSYSKSNENVYSIEDIKIPQKPRLHCPCCGGKFIESTLMPISEDLDPNQKYCIDCGYSWKQLRPKDGGIKVKGLNA